MKKRPDWPLHPSEGYGEAAWKWMGPSKSGWLPNTDLPIGDHSSRVYLEDRKDNKFKTGSLAPPPLLVRPWMIVITAHMYRALAMHVVLCAELLHK